MDREFDPADLQTPADASRALPSHGPGWDDAIAYGIDVTLLERNLRLTPAERIQQLDESNRWRAQLRERLPSPLASTQDAIRSDLETYGPEREE